MTDYSVFKCPYIHYEVIHHKADRIREKHCDELPIEMEYVVSDFGLDIILSTFPNISTLI